MRAAANNGAQAKIPILPCGVCGGAAREDLGVSAPGQPPPVRFRCRDMRCVSGPLAAEVVSAVHAWNRLTQGWMALDVLKALSDQIPELAPQIHKAMQARFEAVLAAAATPTAGATGPHLEA